MRFEFTKRPIPGFDFECLLLEQWAAWVRSDCVMESFSNATPVRDLWMSEHKIEQVEATIIRLDGDTRHILKSWFLWGNVDYENRIVPALYRFRYKYDEVSGN